MMKNKTAGLLAAVAAMGCVAFAEDAAENIPATSAWNMNALKFTYAPEFDVPPVEGAHHYVMKVYDGSDATPSLRFETPHVSLEKLWDNLKDGRIIVTVEAQHEPWAVTRPLARWQRVFVKTPKFKEGSYAPAARSYAEAARLGGEYLLKKPALAYLREHGRPDPAYTLNHYPTKMYSATICAMVDILKSADADDAAKALARKTADASLEYLLSIELKDDTAFPYWTPTYIDDKAVAEGRRENLLVHPAEEGMAYLALYGVTHDERLPMRAKAIAEHYLRLQGEDGTWPVKVYEKSGKPVAANRLQPNKAIPFLEAMYEFTKDERYRRSADRAFAFFERGPLVDWNWEGQFEDQSITAKYVNLTKHPACWTAGRLLAKWPDDPHRVAQARAILRYVEDQFVFWETRVKPYNMYNFACSHNWVTPCVVEQYHYYIPVDASAAVVIRAYLALWRATGDREALAKARALGDAMTRAQKPDGRIPTIWCDGWCSGKDETSDWINCTIHSLAVLRELAKEDGK